MLPTDQFVQDAPGSPAALTSLGTIVTIATWVLLIAINLWCLRKLFAGDPPSSQEG